MEANQTSRFPNGVVNVGAGSPAQDFKYPDPARFHTYFNDFDSFTAAQWVVTETQAGATQAIIDGAGGLLALVNSGADNDLNSIQLAQETFRWAPAKDFIVDALFMVDSITLTDALVGVAIRDTAPIADLPSDGIFFLVTAGTGEVVGHIRKDGASTTMSLGTLAVSTMARCTIQYNAVTGEFVGYFNGAAAGRTGVVTNGPNDEDLAVTIAVQNGDGNARTLTADWIHIGSER